MTKPVQIANSFMTFIDLCKTYCNKKIEMNQLDLNEEEIFAKLEETKNKIHSALCDDFNTCLVIDELQELVNFMNKKFQKIINPSTNEETFGDKGFNRNYGCVMSISNYVQSILYLFGINFESGTQSSEVIL